MNVSRETVPGVDSSILMEFTNERIEGNCTPCGQFHPDGVY